MKTFHAGALYSMNIVIIGGVATGLTAAYSIRKNLPSAKVTILERGSDISYGACGFPYYIEGLIEKEEKLIAKNAAEVLQDGFDLKLRHEAVDVDFHQKEVSVKDLRSNEMVRIPYDKLVIATGANAKRLPYFNRMRGVFPLNTLEDANHIKNYIEEAKPGKALIIGGGNKGIELLETLTLLAIDTQVVEFLPRILGRYDEEFSALLLKELKGEGHRIHTGEEVTSAEANDKSFVKKVITSGDTYEVDLVIESIGLHPNTDFLQGKGLKMEKGAIVTDRYGRTSISDVYAGGDCALIYDHLTKENVYLPLGTNANKMGRLIGLSIAGKEPDFKGVQGSAMLKVFEYEMAITGLTDQRAKELGLSFDSVMVRTRNKSGYYPGGTEFFVKVTFDSTSGKILGGQVFGREGSALRIQALVACVYAGLSVHDLEYMDFGYIPPLNSVWDSLNIAGRKAAEKLENNRRGVH